MVGPTEGIGDLLKPGAAAPEATLSNDRGTIDRLSNYWSEGPALVMFWRQFGCTCGVGRAERLAAEYDSYLDAGLTPVVICQGDPDRAAAYRSKYEVPCPILCDPGLEVYKAYGVGQYSVEQQLFDAPQKWWSHSHEIGLEFLETRRKQGRPPVDDPWRAAAEFVVRSDGLIQLSYAYQYCEDWPDSRVLTTAGHLASQRGPL